MMCTSHTENMCACVYLVNLPYAGVYKNKRRLGFFFGFVYVCMCVCECMLLGRWLFLGDLLKFCVHQD